LITNSPVRVCCTLSFFFLSFICNLTVEAAGHKITYPTTKTDNVVEFYNGQKAFDRYRWLEDTNSPETKSWVESQNYLTRSFLDSLQYRQTIKERLSELFNVPREITPVKFGKRYFTFQYPENKTQYALYVRDSLDCQPRLVIDPNLLKDSGTIAISSWAANSDGSLVAYALSYGGSDWQEIHIHDIKTSKDYEEVLKWCEFVSISWSPDNSGFYYTRWPQAGSVKIEDEFRSNRIYWHRLGNSQENDSLVYEAPQNESAWLSNYVTKDNKYLIFEVNKKSENKIDLYYLKFGEPGGFKRLLHNVKEHYVYIDNINTMFYFKIGLKAPGGKVVAIDLENPSKQNTIIPSQDLVLDYAIIANNLFVVAYMDYVYHKLEIFDLSGKYIKDIELPALGTVYALEGEREDSTILLGFESFIFPSTTYIYNIKSGAIRPFEKNEFPYDLSPYVTRQVQYESDGGVKVPMFLTYNKDLLLNGQNPTILYGYGGFGISLLPRYSRTILFWLENGGVYAVANIRGGGEFGQNWHWAGWGPYKQTSFDDFANAAKWLIKSGITKSSKLAIWGSSNGGLLTAVSMEQNPKLFGAVISQVPLTDMLRFNKFTVGRNWINEYGDPEEDVDSFRRLFSYSPVHRVSHWDKYPPVLVTTGENDDRVPPFHAYKFIAALQAEDDGIKPKLLRVENDAGHGSGKPLDKTIDEQTDIYTFIFNSLGISIKQIGQ
jgi:prolyl oligopeptidase